nr:uncharacterized protein LOC127308466 [Lolium perenne]
MASPAPPNHGHGAQLSLPDLRDELLEEIFLRLPGPAALARASTVCASFHRVITERAFLRQFRKRHPPPLLGLVDEEGVFLPAQAPHPSAPLARALVAAGDFTYSFVPEPDNNTGTPKTWFPRDARDGRVLLEHTSRFVLKTVFTDLAVCDPLSRRYVLLPPIPEDMTSQEEHLLEFRPMLAPIREGKDEADEDETSFKVICVARYRTKLASFVFSSITGQWRIAASTTWSSLGAVEPSWKRMYRYNYFRGCFYWTDLWRDKLLVLDTGVMEFSTVAVLTGTHVQLRNQPGQRICMSIVVDGTEGALEMLTLAGDYGPTSFYLYHTTQKSNGGSSIEWNLENVMELPRRWLCSTMGATEGFLFLRCDREAQLDGSALGFLPEDNHVNFLSLEVKTFELKQVCMAKYHPNCVHSYFGFPPSLSKSSL